MMRMVGKDGGPWIGTKVYIIYGSIYELVGEGKWSKTSFINKKVSTERIGRAPGLQGFAK